MKLKQSLKQASKRDLNLFENIEDWLETKCNKNIKISSVKDIFSEINPYFDLIDCKLIVDLSETFLSYSDKDLVEELQVYREDARTFRCSTLVKNLNESLQSKYKAHITNLDKMPQILLQLHTPWIDCTMKNLECLIKQLLPSNLKQSIFKFITILPGSVVVKYPVLDCTFDSLMKHAQEKLQFMHFVGIFGFFINEDPVFKEEERENFTFERTLSEAVIAGHNEAVQFLLTLKNIDINHLNEKGQSALTIACELGHDDIIYTLLTTGASISFKDNNSWRALMTANENNHLKASTGFIVACICGQLNVVKHLMHEESATQWLHAAFISACLNDHHQIASLILQEKADSEWYQKIKTILYEFFKEMCETGHIEIVKVFLQEKVVDVNTKDGNYCTALMVACRGKKDNSGIVELLLDYGADPNVQMITSTSTNFTALMTASCHGQLNSVKLLLKANANPHIQCPITGDTALSLAVMFMHHSIAQELLIAGASINDAKKFEKTMGSTLTEYCVFHIFAKEMEIEPEYETSDITKTLQLVLDAQSHPDNDPFSLAMASHFGHKEIAEILINAGHNCNTLLTNDKRGLAQIFETSGNYNPFIMACEKGHTEIVELFLLKGHADPNIEPNNGNTALECACLLIMKGENRSQIVRLLVEAGAGPRSGDDDNFILLLASYFGHVQMVETLINAGYNINIPLSCTEKWNDQDNDGWNALMLACDNCHTEVVQVLLRERIDPNYKTNNNLTALMIACRTNSTDSSTIVQLLLEAGADPNIQIKSHTSSIVIGATALMYASRHASLETVKILLKCKADPNIMTRDFNLTALFFATASARPAIVNELIKAGAITSTKYNIGVHGIPINVAPSQLCANLLLAKNLKEIHISEELSKKICISPQQIAQSLKKIKDEDIIETLQILHEKKAQIDNDDDPFSLIVASSAGNAQAVELLLQYGCNPNTPSPLYNLLNKIPPGSILSEWNALIFACYNGHTQVVQKLLADERVDVNLQLSNGCNALMYCSYLGHTQIVKLLLKKKVELNTKAENGVTALIVACSLKTENSQIVQLLLEAGADPNAEFLNHVHYLGWTTALISACNRGYLRSVQLLLQANADPNIHHPVTNCTALGIAICEVQPEIIQALLEAGAHTTGTVTDVHFNSFTLTQLCANVLLHQQMPKIEDSSIEKHFKVFKLIVEATPNPDDDPFSLIIASITGCVQIVELLLKAGYDPRVPLSSSRLWKAIFEVHSEENNVQYPSLTFACTYGHHEVVLSLIKAIDNPNVAVNENTTPLMIACQYGQFDTVHVLLQNGADPNICDDEGSNALHHALWFNIDETNRMKIVKVLLTHNTNLHLQEKNGMTPLMLASIKGSDEVVLLLLKENADPNIFDRKGMTALMHACRHGYPKAAELLLKTNSIDPSQTDNSEQSPLIHAALQGHEDVIDIILSYCNPDNMEILIGFIAACQRNHDSLMKKLAQKININVTRHEANTSCSSYDAVIKDVKYKRTFITPVPIPSKKVQSLEELFGKKPESEFDTPLLHTSTQEHCHSYLSLLTIF